MKNSRFYPWLVVFMLGGVALLNYMDRQMLSTMRDTMQVDIAELQSAESFGFLMAVFLWIYGLMSPISGMIGDRFSKKWLIVGSLFVWSSVTFLMGMATTYDEIFLLRALMGVSEALYLPTGLALISEYHTGGSRSLAIGIHMTGLYIGQAVGGFGATIAESYSWQTTFHWFGLVGVAYAVVLILFLKDKKTEAKTVAAAPAMPKDSVFEGLKKVLKNPAFWIILVYFAVPSLPGWATKNWLPTLFAENLNLPMSTAGPISTITIAFSSFVGVILGGWLSDKWVQKILRGRVYVSAIGLGMTIPSLWLLGLGHSLVAIILAGVLFGVGYGMWDANNMPILCQFISARNRATAYGIMNMTGVFAGAVVTHKLGALTDAGNLGVGFALMTVVVALALALELWKLHPETDNME